MQLRARVTEFVLRFVQLAARHEEDTFGSTAICFPSLSFSDGQLGSGTIPEDPKEMAMNIGRIEGWRRSVSYELFKAVSTVSQYSVSHLTCCPGLPGPNGRKHDSRHRRMPSDCAATNGAIVTRRRGAHDNATTVAKRSFL